MTGIALIAQKVVLCQGDSSWKLMTNPQCNSMTSVMISRYSHLSYYDFFRMFNLIWDCTNEQGHPEDLEDLLSLYSCYLPLLREDDRRPRSSESRSCDFGAQNQDLLARDIDLSRPITFFAGRESFFSSEKNASTAKRGSGSLAVPSTAYKSNSSGMSKSSAGSASSSYSTDSTYHEKVVMNSDDHKADFTSDLASINRSNCSVSSVYAQDTLSTDPLVNPPLRSTISTSHHRNGTGYTTGTLTRHEQIPNYGSVPE
ncbi:hypothetical protein K435DRAFT_844700 [Dendrothele bispora CBS 962.96]|uniref:Uncharacterized protein n=1 Tax=Dendrothele bispora (strain CBS 962.96) TaxID=1314807 RepID=A0A4S8L036_DENBC|nr:hypothetical protein K435DRAFT_844700 [Dendrothele bispora CBS 962.96]